MSAVLENQPVAKLVRAMEKSRLREASYDRVIYSATAFEDTTPEDMLKPEYWAHVAATLKSWDRIEARANDGTWWAEFIVLYTGKAMAKVHLIRTVDLTEASPEGHGVNEFADYQVKWRGPHSKWSVIRNSDSEVVHEGAESKGNAETWLKSQLKALGR